MYFFESDRFRDYDGVEIEITMKIRDFIKYAVEDYCAFFLQFSSEIINERTYQLKLADFYNKSDENLLEIDWQEVVEPFFGQTLCLTRKVGRESNLRLIQEQLSESEVFQVAIPFQKGNRMFDIPKERNFGYLIEKVLKACDIVESPSDFLLVEYKNLTVYDKTTPITKI